jgi:hypothetical protein
MVIESLDDFNFMVYDKMRRTSVITGSFQGQAFIRGMGWGGKEALYKLVSRYKLVARESIPPEGFILGETMKNTSEFSKNILVARILLPLTPMLLKSKAYLLTFPNFMDYINHFIAGALFDHQLNSHKVVKHN